MTLSLHLSVPLQMLSDSHSLLDEVIQVLRQVRGQAFGLEDSQDLVAGDKTHLGHTMGVPQNNTWTKEDGRTKSISYAVNTCSGKK